MPRAELKVYNTEPYGYSESAENLWRSSGFEYIAGSWEEVDNTSEFHGISTLIVRLGRFVDENVLSKFTDLKYLISATTGWDHIDLDYLAKTGIELNSLRGHNEFLNTIPSTAEHTWALLMALTRNISPADQHVRAGNWNRDDFRGNQLWGKTIGIVGLGRTGKKVARYAECFGLKVAFFDPNESHETYNQSQSLEELAALTDVLSIHVHLNEDTRNLIDSNVLKHLKKGAVLVNTSRSGVWSEADIVTSLSEGQIAGVATDVLSGEPNRIGNSPLWKARERGLNVLITPHLGGATWEAMWMCEDFMVEQFLNSISNSPSV